MPLTTTLRRGAVLTVLIRHCAAAPPTVGHPTMMPVSGATLLSSSPDVSRHSQIPADETLTNAQALSSKL